MPKSNAAHRHIDANDTITFTQAERNALIRHHLGEASTHLGMVKTLIINEDNTTDQPDFLLGLKKVGRFLKVMYVQHGGHKDA